ncbi:MAG: CusA/CzcA family heavy metal efflux RND transporter [Cyanobacteriota bacterium]
MINKIIEYSCKNRFIILIFTILLIFAGLWSVKNSSLDAIPDVSDNQVIVLSEWQGKPPQIIEDQITYPLSVNLQGLPNVKAVRASSSFGFSMIYIIFEDNVDIYWARTRVLERLNSIKILLPEEVTPALGPDGTGVGHVYWYTLESKTHDLSELRALQDWYVRYQLSSVAGVAEVASIGGFVKQYQIDIDPNKLNAYHLDINDIIKSVQRSNNEAGGKILELNDQEYYIRAQGYIKNIEDIELIVIKTDKNGIPVFLKDVAYIQLGGDIRRGLLDKNGTGEVVGGIVVTRYGANARQVIEDIKKKIKEIEKGLPQGVRIKTAYDRTDLINKSIDTLKHTLKEEVLIVSLIVIVFLLDIRGSLIIVITLPLSILFSFILMKLFGISSNIMSLGGIAIAIGVIVDSGIVIVENTTRHLAEKSDHDKRSNFQIILDSSMQVGKPIFFSLLIIILSFTPVFMLTGREGKMFMPLAFTKTFAMLGASIISITLVPVLMTLIMKYKFLPERNNPVSIFFGWIYNPLLKLVLRFKKTAILLAIISMIIILPKASNIGTEFMPPLNEGSILFMPVTLPNVTITEAKRIVQLQDKIIKSHPEVEYVLGKVGRAETATDPAPVSMIETIIILKPETMWRAGITKEDIISELDEKLQIPGVTNGWTQPIINRIDMLATGVRTMLAIKIFGEDLKELEKIALNVEELIKPVDGVVDLYTERVTGGKYLEIEINRKAVARYGIPIGKVQDVIETAVGGMNISTQFDKRYRFPIRVRYARDYRDSLEAIKNLEITMPDNLSHIPLSALADINLTDGPPMINSENGNLRSIVQFNVRNRDMGSVVKDINKILSEKLNLPAGYYYSVSGQYENMKNAQDRLVIIIPIVLLVILVFLYFTFNSLLDSLLVLISVPFALIGGLLLQIHYGYNFSVAVTVGYIALFGVAVETGIVMLVYLNEALKKYIEKGEISEKIIYNATIEGATLRLRPKLMTTFSSLIGLIPIMWATGIGSDLMKPIATPLIGGIVTSTILVLLILPALFLLTKVIMLNLGLLYDNKQI